MRKTDIKIDARTLARLRKHDPVARDAVYRALGPYVFTLARRMLASSALAEDVLHETFVEIFTKISTFQGTTELVPWARRIAINKCLMFLRSSWVTRRVDLNVTDLVLETPSADGTPEQRELANALDELADVARAVVWLHDVEGYTHAEIARLMGRSVSFSKSQLARAHAKLRTLLADATNERELRKCRRILGN